MYIFSEFISFYIDLLWKLYDNYDMIKTKERAGREDFI